MIRQALSWGVAEGAALISLCDLAGMERTEQDTASDLEPSIEEDEKTAAEPVWRRRVKSLAPWVIAAGLLGYLFSDIAVVDAWQAAQSARLEIFLPIMLGCVLIWFLIDSAAYAYIFTRFNAPLSWREARSLRGMTYLLTPINFNLGTAAVILHLRTSKKIAALESTSTVVFYQSVDGMLLAGLVLVGVSLLPDSAEILALRRGAFGIEVFQTSSLALLMTSVPSWGWLMRFRGLGLFRTHRLAVVRDVAVLMALKGLYFLVFIGLFWVGCQSFGVSVPFTLAMAATPAILLAGALPITPAGLGTQQAAMVFFFSPYGDEAAILAFGLTFPIALLVGRCLLGLPYLRQLPELRRAVAEQRAGGS